MSRHLDDRLRIRLAVCFPPSAVSRSLLHCEPTGLQHPPQRGIFNEIACGHPELVDGRAHELEADDELSLAVRWILNDKE
jgi:hypothetical protein